MGLENVKYDAFISYRHCELDSFVSENLHKKLENFKLPKSVLKKMGLKERISLKLQYRTPRLYSLLCKKEPKK